MSGQKEPNRPPSNWNVFSADSQSIRKNPPTGMSNSPRKTPANVPAPALEAAFGP